MTKNTHFKPHILDKIQHKAKEMNCILCGNSKLNVLEQIDKNSLISLYKRAFGIDVANIIGNNLIYHHCTHCDLRFFTLENGEIPSGDEAFYNHLNKLPWYYMQEKHEYHFAKRFINQDSKVLEVGCGSAAFTNFLPNKRHYVGLEFSSDAKEQARQRGIHIENTSIEEYAKCNSGKFDVACSFQVLEHVNNPHSFINAQIACLSRGGAALDDYSRAKRG